MLSDEENQFNFYITRISWGVYCNANLPQLWPNNYLQQKDITDKIVDDALRLGVLSSYYD